VGSSGDDIARAAGNSADNVAGAAVNSADNSAGAIANSASNGGVDLHLHYKPGWSSSQRAAAQQKVTALSNGDTVVVHNPGRSGTSAASRYRSAGGTIPSGSDVDHVIDLQLGGADTIANMQPLDASVNRSLGAQIRHQTRGLPAGTRINVVTIGD
jgi:filamentous hemagglutinin